MSVFSLEESEKGFLGFACFQLWFSVDNDWNCVLISLTIPKELHSFNCLCLLASLSACSNSWRSWLLSLLMLPLMLQILWPSLAQNFSEQSHLGWQFSLSLTSATFSWKVSSHQDFSILQGSRSQILRVATDNSVRFSHLNSGVWLLLLFLFLPWTWQDSCILCVPCHLSFCDFLFHQVWLNPASILQEVKVSLAWDMV